MSKSFLTHLAGVLIVHLFILFGSWQLNDDSVLSSPQARVLTMNLSHDENKTIRKEVSQPKEKRLPPTPSESRPSEITPAEETTVASTPSLSAAREAELIDMYKAELRQKIDENKFYPEISRRMGQRGTVVVAFTLLEDGQIINIRVDRPSAFQKLNDAGVEAVKKVQRFRPIPKELGITQMELKIPVKFVTL